MEAKNCIGCGGSFPDIDGPVHPYMASTPGCWEAFCLVLAREYSSPALYAVHRLTVDTYAVQHPGTPSRQSIQSIGVHLIRLCLALEHELPPEQANDAMLAAAKTKADFTWLEPPDSVGEITVEDVARVDITSAGGYDEHCQRVRQWAACAWRAWATHHEAVRALVPNRYRRA